MELFPRLGYYFIVFRALDVGTSFSNHSNEAKSSDVRAANVYLTVFSEGICSVRIYII